MKPNIRPMLRGSKVVPRSSPSDQPVTSDSIPPLYAPRRANETAQRGARAPRLDGVRVGDGVDSRPAAFELPVIMQRSEIHCRRQAGPRRSEQPQTRSLTPMPAAPCEVFRCPTR